MTDRSVTHSTFTLERSFPVPTERVYAAWAEPELKARWFTSPDTAHALDFRVGGEETASGVHSGQTITFTTTYLDIVPQQRIAYTSTMTFGDELSTVSLTTVEFVAEGDKTRLVLTEHGAYLDGHEKPEWREEGTASQLDKLGADLMASAV